MERHIYDSSINDAHDRSIAFEDADEEMAKKRHHPVGTHVKTPAGHGHVASVHTQQTFYGVRVGSGMSFFPSSQVEKANDDTPGAPDTDEADPSAP